VLGHIEADEDTQEQLDCLDCRKALNADSPTVYVRTDTKQADFGK